MLTPGKNTGFIEKPPSSTDFIAGTLPSVVRIESGDWRSFEPQGEMQKVMGPSTETSSTGFETNACVSFSANDAIEVFLTYLIDAGKVPDEHIKWLNDNGYFDEEGNLNFSDRFTAKVSGTTIDGNSLQAVADAIRHNGLIPEALWPMPTDAIKKNPGSAWEIYYATPPQRAFDMGKAFLERFTISYEWVFSAPGQATHQKIADALKIAPLQVATAVCPPWNTAEVIQACGLGVAHATIITFVDADYHILDHYNPFRKLLAGDYTIPYGFRYIVACKPVQAVVDASRKAVDVIPGLIDQIDRLPASEQPYWKAVVLQILESLKRILGG
jgi:hypothetical protein